ncbi:MAG: TolC family protein, partial [bacterium]|nr:TolC family protein [bacterium]
MNKSYKKIITLGLLLSVMTISALAIEDVQPTKKSKFKLFQKTEKTVTLQELEKKVNKIKGSCGVTEFHTPKVIEFGARPEKVVVMSIEDCVKYALEHRHDLAASEDRIRVAESGIGQARSNYAPRLFANVDYGMGATR